MTIGVAILFLAAATTHPLPTLTPLQQSVLTRTRSQAATKLTPAAAARLKTVSSSLTAGPALNDYADATRRAVTAAFPAVKLTEGEVNSLSAIVLADTIDALKVQASELGAGESTKVQMAMDRLSKMMTTLSNLLKKISDSGDAITKSLK
jgi:hypothetical protein